LVESNILLTLIDQFSSLNYYFFHLILSLQSVFNLVLTSSFIQLILMLISIIFIFQNDSILVDMEIRIEMKQ